VHKKFPLFFLVFFIVFLLSLQVIVDPDFGWHLRAGQSIVTTKSIPKTDLFSFSTPNYPYVFHSWAGETVIYLSYKFLGLWGSSLLFALIVTISIYLLFKSTQVLTKSQPNYSYFLLITPLAYTLAGGKMRTFNLLFLSLVYLLFLKFERQNSKMIWLTPIVFLLWVNFHASFLLGIPIFFILATSSIFKKRDKVSLPKLKTYIAVFCLSALATLINPYFINAHKQAIIMFFNSYFTLHNINLDWQSALTAKGIEAFTLVLFLLILFLLFFKSSVSLFQKLLLVSFYVLSLVSSRFLVPLIIFFIPIFYQFVKELETKINPNIKKSIAIRFAYFSFLSVLILFIVENLLVLTYSYSSLKNYSDFINYKYSKKLLYDLWPYQANRNFEKELQTKRVLTNADSGGFLLLQNPQAKVFYYGAMDNFIIDGKSFTFEYLKLQYAISNWKQILNQYEIDSILLPKTYKIVSELQKDQGWYPVYEDHQAVIMAKKDK